MSSLLSSLPTLLARFQSRYPTGSLIAELLTIHDGNYVVRALVQIGQTPIASGMATAASVELAEDQAKVRALEALGLQMAGLGHGQPSGFGGEQRAVGQPAVRQAAADPQGAIAPQPEPVVNSTASSAPAPSTLDFDLDYSLPDTNSRPESISTYLARRDPPPSPKNIPETGPDASPETDRDAGQASGLNSGHQPDPESQPAAPNAPSQKPRRKSSRLPEADVSAAPTSAPGAKPAAGQSAAQKAITAPESTSIDLSDVIAQTSVELRRLGWSEEQGRQHLEDTYSKRSRQQLTDPELFDFLSYLQTLPSPGEA